MSLRRRRCVFRCDALEEQAVPLHRFPNPNERADLFAAWVSAAGDTFKERDPMRIFRNNRVCDQHFDPSTKKRCRRIIPSAIPTINLHRIQQSIRSIVETDHNYCGPQMRHFQGSALMDIINQVLPGPSSAETFPILLSQPIASTCLTVDDKDTTHSTRKKKNAESEGEDTRDDGLPLEYGLPSPDPDDEVGESAENTHLDEKPIFSWQKQELIEADDGESAENTHLNEKPIFSWQEGQLIEADDPDDPTPAPVPKIPEEVTTLSLFRKLDEDEVTQTEPAQVVPEGDEYQCKDCTQVIDGFSWWCVQCYGARCGACAALPPHRAHYVLRAPRGSRRSQTEAVLANIRLQLQNETLPVFDIDGDGVKVEVKAEPEEPADLAPDLQPAPPDPLSDEPLTHLVPLPPGPQANVDSSNTAEQRDDHHLFKRPRLMNYRPKASVTSDLVTPKLSEAKINELSLLGILQNKKGSQPNVRPQQSILNTHSASNQSDSRGVQLIVKQGSRGPQKLRKGARHIKLKTGSPQLAVVQQFSEGSQLIKITVNHPLGSQTLRKVEKFPKGQPVLKDLDLRSPRAHTSKELIHAAVKVTSEAQAPETAIIDLDNEADEVEFLDEEILDSEAENRKRNIINEEHDEEDRGSEEGNTIDDTANQESRVETEIGDLESKVGDIINKNRIDQESNVESEMESEIGEYRTDRTDKESYVESQMDDNLYKDSVDETAVEDALERIVLTRNAARAPIRGPQEEMVRKLPAEAMVQLRPLTSLDISQWTTGNG